MPETRVQGPDGQEYVFPEGVSQDEMRAAMARRYPVKPEPTLQDALNVGDRMGLSMPSEGQFRDMYGAAQERNAGFEQMLSERGAKRRKYLESDPENIGWSTTKTDAQLGATQYGKSDGLFLGFGDEVIGLFNPKEGKRLEGLKNYARTYYPQDFGGGELHGASVNTLATLPAAGPKLLQAANYAPKVAKPVVAGAQGGFAWDAAHQMGTGTGSVGERLGDFDVERSALATGIGAAGGTVLGGAGSLFAGGRNKQLMNDAAAEIEALDGGAIRPQALGAFNRLLTKSGLTDDQVIRLHNEVRNRLGSIEGVASSAAGRKRTFQHYMEILAEDKAGELYNPQAAANILMTVQERANSAIPRDTSRGIVGAAVKADRESQVPFLEQSAQNVAKGTRIGTRAQVAEAKNALSAEYDRILETAPRQGEGADILRDVLKSDPKAATALKRKAKNAGFTVRDKNGKMSVDVNAYIDANPYRAGHWMRSRLSKDARTATGTERGDLLDSVSEIDEVLDQWSTYADTKRGWGTEESLLKASSFGDRLFGGTQNNVIQNPGMRAELVSDFNALSDRQKEIALISIRDQALGKISGGADDAQARLSSMNNRNVLDFLEQVGQKDFADDIRAIARENQLLSVADAGNPLRQSATFSNAQARAEAPALYNSTIANAVDNSTPGTMLGEGMLMAFAPHYQGAYAAYRGGRLAAKAGFGTRTKTLEDMTRFLMSRPEPAPQNAFSPQTPPTSGGALPPAEGPAPQNAFAPTAKPVQSGPGAIAGPELGGAVVGGAAGATQRRDPGGARP